MTPSTASLYALLSVSLHLISCVFIRTQWSRQRLIVAHPDICLTVAFIQFWVMYAFFTCR